MLGSLDVDEFIEEYLKEQADWEKNFKALKIRGRDAEKLPKFVLSLLLVVYVFSSSSPNYC